MTTILNQTPHPINIIGEIGTTTIPSNGVARVSQNTNPLQPIEHEGNVIPIVESTFGNVKGLPDMASNTVIIVSSIVKAALPDRYDLVVPTDFVRNEQGHILGCRALSI